MGPAPRGHRGMGGAGIRLNALAPGAIMTPCWSASSRRRPKPRKSTGSRVPIGGFGDAGQPADWVVFMVSESADFLCGSVVFVDGGSDAYFFGPTDGPVLCPSGGYRSTCGGHASSSEEPIMKARAALLALVAATSLVGCTSKTEPPSSPPKAEGPQTIEISYDELLSRNRSAAASVSRSATPSPSVWARTPPRASSWTEKMLISDPKVVTQTGHEVIAPAADKPGAPGRRSGRCRPKEPGNTTVSTTHGRPWPDGGRNPGSSLPT